MGKTMCCGQRLSAKRNSLAANSSAVTIQDTARQFPQISHKAAMEFRVEFSVILNCLRNKVLCKMIDEEIMGL